MSLKYSAALAASKGGRRYQEDFALAVVPGSEPVRAAGEERAPILGPAAGMLLVLCDGMGGHVGGATASRIAAEHFAAEYAQQPAKQPVDMPLRLETALRAANDALAGEIALERGLRGMGTTLVGVHLGPGGLHWVSVGDSPLYLWRRGELARINADHSLAPEIDRLASAGRISAFIARNDPRRHFLRSAVSGEEIELIDLSAKPIELFADDIVIAASDGVHSLDDRVIAALLDEHAGHDAGAVAAGLVRRVEDAGVINQDNTTVIAVRVAAQAP